MSKTTIKKLKASRFTEFSPICKSCQVSSRVCDIIWFTRSTRHCVGLEKINPAVMTQPKVQLTGRPYKQDVHTGKLSLINYSTYSDNHTGVNIWFGLKGVKVDTPLIATILKFGTLILIERQMNQNKKQVIHQNQDRIYLAVSTCIQPLNFCLS